GGFVGVRTVEDPGTISAQALQGATQIVDHATVFATLDRRVHLAGTDASGDLVIYFQQSADIPTQFTYDNLTTAHIEEYGDTFVPVASNLVALVAPWGASHLFYLDQRGAVISVWIAPGMEHWVSTNISNSLQQGHIDDNPGLRLGGQITAYATPWGGLN